MASARIVAKSCLTYRKTLKLSPLKKQILRPLGCKLDDIEFWSFVAQPLNHLINLCLFIYAFLLT
jgi:hypothetical protein